MRFKPPVGSTSPANSAHLHIGTNVGVLRTLTQQAQVKSSRKSWTTKSTYAPAPNADMPHWMRADESNSDALGSKKRNLTFVVAVSAVIALGLMVVIPNLMVVIPNLIRARTASARYSCIVATKHIEGAKATWSVEERKQSTDTPAMSDLLGPNAYLRHWPECPEGGRYIIGRIDQRPRCTLPEHFLYSSEILVVDESGQGLGNVRIEVQRTNSTLCVIETQESGFASLSANAYTVAPGWSTAATYLQFSTAGFRTETILVPDMWPLRVVLKKSGKK